MWSLQLEADWAPTQGYVTRPIHGLRNGDVLRLSALVRALGDDGGGVVGLATGKSYELATHTKLASSAQKAWTPVSVEDTVSTAPGDTVWIVLSSFNTEITVRRGLFDRISLHRTRLVDRIGPALQVDGAQRARPATPAGTDGF